MIFCFICIYVYPHSPCLHRAHTLYRFLKMEGVSDVLHG